MHTCTKRYDDIPFAHRQHNHTGHCRLIHGHNWAFIFTFIAEKLDANEFVVDFGELRWLRDWLMEKFDHKLVLNEDDPALGYIAAALMPKGAYSETFDTPLLKPPFAQITTVPNASSEGLAKYLFRFVDAFIYKQTTGRVKLQSVQVCEDSRNSATFFL